MQNQIRRNFGSMPNPKLNARRESLTPGTEGPNKPPETTKDEKQKADTLLNVFTSVFTDECRENIPDFDQMTEEAIEELEIDEDMVKKKLKELKVNKSPGPDGIHPRVLYELRDKITTPLTIIYNRSISSNEVPQDWRDAHISAIVFFLVLKSFINRDI